MQGIEEEIIQIYSYLFSKHFCKCPDQSSGDIFPLSLEGNNNSNILVICKNETDWLYNMYVCM